VGTASERRARLKRREKTWRNCSSRVATCLISFSLVLPTRKKFCERTLVQVSLAAAAAGSAASSKTRLATKSLRDRPFIC
jgi:hypothetical protein